MARRSVTVVLPCPLRRQAAEDSYNWYEKSNSKSCTFSKEIDPEYFYQDMFFIEIFQKLMF